MPKGGSLRPYNRDQKKARDGSGDRAQIRREGGAAFEKKESARIRAQSAENDRKAAAAREEKRAIRQQEARRRADQGTGRLAAGVAAGRKSVTTPRRKK